MCLPGTGVCTEPPPEEACSVAVCAEVTDAIVAENVALALLVEIFTEAGTATAELSLARFTVTPPLGAGVFRLTVQLSVPEPVKVALVQLNPDTAGAVVLALLPEPFREIVVLPCVEEPDARCTCALA